MKNMGRNIVHILKLCLCLFSYKFVLIKEADDTYDQTEQNRSSATKTQRVLKFWQRRSLGDAASFG
jgi:hypothetical protein